jgi:hypothetical protein
MPFRDPMYQRCIKPGRWRDGVEGDWTAAGAPTARAVGGARRSCRHRNRHVPPPSARDVREPSRFIVFRDPDNIQLEVWAFDPRQVTINRE